MPIQMAAVRTSVPFVAVATEGNAQSKRPGFSAMVGRAKLDAWAAAASKSTADLNRNMTT